MTTDARRALAYVHFGDLHITTADAANYRDFVALIADADARLRGDVDFAVLPGDNADDGTIAEYRLVRRAIGRLGIPLEIRTGDHDRKSGSLENYREMLEPGLARSRSVGGYRCITLDSMDGGRPDVIELGAAQVAWLERELAAARASGEPSLLFMHAYPSEHGAAADRVTHLIAEYEVRLVDMGHTHYNELGNDGTTIYAATRSTGQIEEGPVGFSLTAVDGGVVSWRFKALERPWPFVLVTSPADRSLVTDAHDPSQVVRGRIAVRARVWGASAGVIVTYAVDGRAAVPMTRGDLPAEWTAPLDAASLAKGVHRLRVRADDGATSDEETIDVAVDADGTFEKRDFAIDKESTIGAYPAKGILGTRLGPNDNGHGW